MRNSTGISRSDLSFRYFSYLEEYKTTLSSMEDQINSLGVLGTSKPNSISKLRVKMPAFTKYENNLTLCCEI